MFFRPFDRRLATDDDDRPSSYFFASRYEAVSNNGWTAVRRDVNDNGRVYRDGHVIDAKGNTHVIDYDQLPSGAPRPRLEAPEADLHPRKAARDDVRNTSSSTPTRTGRDDVRSTSSSTPIRTGRDASSPRTQRAKAQARIAASSSVQPSAPSSATAPTTRVDVQRPASTTTTTHPRRATYPRP